MCARLPDLRVWGDASRLTDSVWLRIGCEQPGWRVKSIDLLQVSDGTDVLAASRWLLWPPYIVARVFAERPNASALFSIEVEGRAHGKGKSVSSANKLSAMLPRACVVVTCAQTPEFNLRHSASA